jgi:hypothetical protein
MNFSPILAALGGGAAGLASSSGLGGGAALSPLLAMLLHKKNGGASPQADPSAPAAPAAPGPSPLIAPQPLAQATGPTLAQNMAANPIPQLHAGMDPAARQRLAAMLLQFGGNMGGFGNRGY